MKSADTTQKRFNLHTRSKNATNGRLKIANRSFPCQLGRSGQTDLKREGDGATPIGHWPALSIYYRADKIARPRTLLPVKIIHQQDGWCDEPLDRNYNRPVTLPYPASTESLWRNDDAYDLLVVLDYNLTKRCMHRGSAIFMHLSHKDARPTAGCLAFSERNLREILKLLRSGENIHIAA